MTEPAAIQKFAPTAPVGTINNLRAMLERSEESIKELLPEHVTTHRLIKLMLVAANRNPDILRCTQASVIETVLRAAELGLDFGLMGGAHAVPFGNQLTMIPDYRGLAKLVRQSGELAYIGADVVYKNDHFIYEKGSEPKISHIPKLDGDRGPKIGAYAVLRMKDGAIYCDFMPVKDIEAVRARSRAGQRGPWVTDWDEMSKKTVLRRTMKLAPMSSDRLERALEIDNEPDLTTPTITTVKPVAPPQAGIRGALDFLASQPEATEDPAPPPERPAAPRSAPKPVQAPPPAPEPEIEAPAPSYSVEAEIPWNDDEPEPEFVPNIPALLQAAKQRLGRHGAALIKAYAKAELGIDNLEQMTEEQYLKLDAYIADAAEASRG